MTQGRVLGAHHGVRIRHGYSKSYHCYILYIPAPTYENPYHNRERILTTRIRWSAIQTLLERSLSDALILLDCCAGAASAAFPTGNSITETISASSWDAIAPDPGRYSFTSTLLEVLQEWKRKTYSVAMLHAEILARLKHPRPERHNGNRFEARTTPVHFMMTANHKAPSVELCRIADDFLPPSLPSGSISGRNSFVEGRATAEDIIGSEPTENVPHVMISLALEEDQKLNVDDWERWLVSIPALAKYVRVQGVFKSHSTLLLLSLPVMVWDMLPDHPACNFIAFIRSNNLATQKQGQGQLKTPTAQIPGVELESDRDSIYSGTTTVTADHLDPSINTSWPKINPSYEEKDKIQPKWQGIQVDALPATRPLSESSIQNPAPQSSTRGNPGPLTNAPRKASNVSFAPQPDPVLSPRAASKTNERPRTRPVLPTPAENRLEEYFINNNPKPTVAVKEFLASSLNLETAYIDVSSISLRAVNHQVLTILLRLGSAIAASSRRCPTNCEVCQWVTRIKTHPQRTAPGWSYQVISTNYSRYFLPARLW